MSFKIVKARKTKNTKEHTFKRLYALKQRVIFRSKSATETLETWEQSPDDIILSRAEKEKIKETADQIGGIMEAKSSLKNKTKEQIEQIDPILEGVDLRGQMSLHRADEIGADLHSEFPWLTPAVQSLWKSVRLSAGYGTPVKVGPTILNGPPGIGKTALLRYFAGLTTMPLERVDASSGAGQMSVIGLETGWGGAKMGRLVETILRHRCGNPIIILDEIDKADTKHTRSGRPLALHDALLGLLEPESAREWVCPYFGLLFDMSHVSWIMTSNDVDLLPPHFLSRCNVIDLPEMTFDQLQDFTIREANRLGLTSQMSDFCLQNLEAVFERNGRADLRAVKRILERALEIDLRPVLH